MLPDTEGRMIVFFIPLDKTLELDGQTVGSAVAITLLGVASNAAMLQKVFHVPKCSVLEI